MVCELQYTKVQKKVMKGGKSRFVNLISIKGLIRFLDKVENRQSNPYRMVIDTGSEISIISEDVWSNSVYKIDRFCPKVKLNGEYEKKGFILAKIQNMSRRVIATEEEWFWLPAILRANKKRNRYVDKNEDPIIIGFEGFLDTLQLIVNPDMEKAILMPLRELAKNHKFIEL